jgi:hypothetical protein
MATIIIHNLDDEGEIAVRAAAIRARQRPHRSRGGQLIREDRAR